ncbi:MAG: fimbrillin family protein [Bacteroidetes bacterium]|nr:fimbrillin family protein [Bacteroidota bacterium]
MKKTLLFATMLAMATFSSCMKDKEIVGVTHDTDAISFNAVMNLSTKANVTDEYFYFNSFGVFSYQTTENYSGETDLGIAKMNNIAVSKEAWSEWSFEGSYFWPKITEKMHFFAVSPIQDVAFVKTSAVKFPNFEYAVKNSVSEQEDLLASSSLNQTKKTNSGVVKLDFRHILSQINLSFKGDEEGFVYTVKKVEIKNIKSNGIYTFSDNNSGSWSDSETSSKTDYEFLLDNFTVSNVIKEINDKEKSLILMPQTTADDAKIVVTYSVIQSESNTEVFDGTKEIDISGKTWTKNSNVCYELTLPSCGKSIAFNVSISEWDSQTTEELSFLDISESELTIPLGEVKTLTAKIIPSRDPEDFINYEWSSDNEEVATVDYNGNVTALKMGSANITAQVMLFHPELGEEERMEATAKCTVTQADKISFNDVEFEKLILNYSPTIDIDGDGKISISEASKVSVLDIREGKYENIEGIERFPNLTVLNCSRTDNLTSVDLTANTELTYLNCESSGITDLNISANTKLKKVFCSSTKIKGLDLTNKAELTKLDCSRTLMESINLNDNILLDTLECNSTIIPDLDLSNNTALNYLSCGDTKIAELDLSSNKSLVTLRCSNIEITELDVSNNTELTLLYCSNKKIIELDVSNNTKLQLLDLDDTGITEINVSSNIALTNLDCKNVAITEIDLSSNTLLTAFCCEGASLTEVDLSSNTELWHFNCKGTPITSINFGTISKLSNFDCGGTQISEIDLSLNQGLTFFKFENSPNLKTVYVWADFKLPFFWKEVEGVSYVEKIN